MRREDEAVIRGKKVVYQVAAGLASISSERRSRAGHPDAAAAQLDHAGSARAIPARSAAGAPELRR